MVEICLRAAMRSSLTALLSLILLASPAMAERPKLNSDPAFNRFYHFLTDPAQRTDYFDPIKYISLGNDAHTYLSISGEIRQRYESQFNPAFGLSGVQKDDYLLSRSLFGADLHLTQNFRSFVQLGHHDVFGKTAPASSSERSHVDLQQAFAEVFLPYYDFKHKLSLRVGRQEALFGNQRFLSISDRGNIRRSFDAARAKLYWDKYQFIAFAGRPLSIGAESFDDTSDNQQFLGGLYAVLPSFGEGHADLYYFRLNRENSRFAQGTANEQRHNLGIRLADNTTAFDYNNEFIYQFGDFGNSIISAWILATDQGHTFKGRPLSPRIGLRANIASGDDDLTDNTLHTFNPLFPTGSFFAQNGLLGPTNFFNFNPNVSIKPRDDVTLTAGADFLWRTNTSDAVYRNPHTPISGTAGHDDRYTGTQTSLLANWKITPHVEASATYVHFFAGDALRDASAGDNDYIAAWVNFRF